MPDLISVLYYDGKSEQPSLISIENSYHEFEKILGLGYLKEYPFGPGNDTCIEIAYPCKADSDSLVYAYFDLGKEKITAAFRGPVLITGFGWSSSRGVFDNISLTSDHMNRINNSFKIIPSQI